MDKIKVQKMKCNKHLKKNIKFIQINEVLSETNSTKLIFCCSSCFNRDHKFNAFNHLIIKDILEEAESDIIPKWPPVNDYQIISDLTEFTSNLSQLDCIKKIQDFFEQLQSELLEKIDIIKKNMINQALELPLERQQIIQKYQEISRILQFKDILNNSQQNSLQEYSNICKQFICQMESQRDQNTQLLQNLLAQSIQFQTNFNLECPNIIKQQLFTLIDQISFFNQNQTQPKPNQNSIDMNQVNNSIQNRSIKVTSDLIMKLVSNKTNFCSDQFLSQLNDCLKKLNPILQQSSIDSIFKENKEQIDFSKINEQNLNLLEDYVKHQSNLQSDQLYLEQIKNSQQMKQMNAILNSKTNFFSSEFKIQLEKLLIDIQPFLNQVNFTNSITDQSKFDLFQQISDEKINDLLYQNDQKGKFYQSLNLIGTKFQNGDQQLLINKTQNGEFEILKIKQNIRVNCISNTNLQQDLKYIFRVQIVSQSEGYNFFIGLMRFENADIKLGYNDMLCCKINSNNQTLVKDVMNFGIQQQLINNGDFKASRENMLELRVCLRDNILELLDYPNYIYKIGLGNQYKNNLTQYSDLRFYLGLYNEGNQIILKDAEIVDQFQNLVQQ
ncbi:hypothetical protein ABPG73_008217 [Tetrahymena malaccensis]